MEVITIEQLRAELSEYKDPDAEIDRMRKNHDLFCICDDLYTRDKSMIKDAVSNLICEPSYVSFEDALSRYDLIPEYVPVCSAATYGKRKSIRYKNDLGYYNFTNIPKEAFPYGVEVYEYGGFSWKMATPEKAICDLLYTRNPLKDADDVKGFLIEGMRIEEEDFKDLDKEKMYLLAGFYDHINMKMLREALS